MSHYNINHETGIAYGVISLRSIDPELAHELWYTHGVDLDYGPALLDYLDDERAGCPDPDKFDVEAATQDFDDSYWNDEPTIEGTFEGVVYSILHLGGAPLLYVRQSPFIVEDAPGCSPCVPYAGDLDSYNRGERGSVRCYNVPAGWLAKED